LGELGRGLKDWKNKKSIKSPRTLAGQSDKGDSSNQGSQKKGKIPPLSAGEKMTDVFA